MLRRRVLFAAGIGSALVATGVAWLVAPVAPAAVTVSVLPPPSPSPAVFLLPVDAPAVAVASAAAPPSKATAAARAALLTATATRVLNVGEQADLVVSLAAHADVVDVAFAVQFDGNVLQVREGFEGDWSVAAGTTARFDAAISPGDDRITVRSALVSPRAVASAGSVALLRFQAIAPGTASVTVGEVRVHDRAGRALPFSLFPTTLQVTAESAAP